MRFEKLTSQITSLEEPRTYRVDELSAGLWETRGSVFLISTFMGKYENNICVYGPGAGYSASSHALGTWIKYNGPPIVIYPD